MEFDYKQRPNTKAYEEGHDRIFKKARFIEVDRRVMDIMKRFTNGEIDECQMKQLINEVENDE